MDRTCPACSARLDQHTTSCPNCGADQTTQAGAADEAVRNTAVVAHLSTFAGLVIPGVVAWVVLASLAAVKASQGQPYRYPLTMRLVR
jgi:uncharacterized Tic20 family protein